MLQELLDHFFKISASGKWFSLKQTNKKKEVEEVVILNLDEWEISYMSSPQIWVNSSSHLNR